MSTKPAITKSRQSIEGRVAMSAFNFTPSAELLEAVRIVTGVDPLFEPEIIRTALRDPSTTASIERLRKLLAKRQAA